MQFEKKNLCFFYNVFFLPKKKKKKKINLQKNTQKVFFLNTHLKEITS